MSQTSEIPASAYNPEMETLGALLDIPTFDGEPGPVSRNPLTSGTRLLQLLPLPGTEFPVRYETSRMRGFQAELRDATVEMCGAAVGLRGAFVLRMPNFEQLRDAAVELRGAGVEVPAQRSQELCQRFGFARSFIDRLYSERHEREDDDGSPSDDAPPSPPPQAAAGLSRRRQ
ncbi:hypothetical protein JCGZ_04166 [Jatropha curcas]|uniref:Uncharacterized protein n=1 Tax=Jatropha curcas TaxID=180498 RepID=A0A067KTL6_JATCU|nr:hypothetical protein JCGZ_04166 [Jatropha curcas]